MARRRYSQAPLGQKHAAEEAHRLMIEDAARSGLSKDIVIRLGFKSMTPDETAKRIGFRNTSYEIPYHDPSGKANGFSRWRLTGILPTEEAPRSFDEMHMEGTRNLDELKRYNKPPLPRYLQPPDTVPGLYHAPIVAWTQILDDRNEVLYITEGEKKAARACVDEIWTIGTGGVRSFAARKFGHSVLLPDYDLLNLEGRRIVLVPDSDFKTNADVRKATYAHADRLIARGAEVFLLLLPANGDKKMGLDDFLVAEGHKTFRALRLQHITRKDCLPFLNLNFTDTGSAEFFARHHGDNARYDHGRKQWFLWSGEKWRPDTKSGIFLLAKDAARAMQHAAVDIDDEEKRKKALAHAMQCEGKVRMEAMLTLAAADEQIATTADEWDRYPLLLGTPGGIIDLETGQALKSSRRLLISKHAAVRFDPDAQCPRWEQFLREIFLAEDGKPDEELIIHMHRSAGYALTGLVHEHRAWMLEGGGRNGKTRFIETIAHILGDYAVDVTFDALTVVSRGTGGNTLTPELARLPGVRFVHVSEVPENAAMNTPLVKKLTGGDAVTVNPKYAAPFTFPPSHKIFIYANHMPRIADMTDSIWARLLRVQCRAAFGTREDLPSAQFLRPKDALLEEKINAETLGILAWMVRGCLDWQRHGLAVPTSVQAATAEYRAREDRLAEFLDACVAAVEDGVVKGSEVYAAYVGWARNNGVMERYIASRQTIYERLRVNFRETLAKGVVTFRGLRLRF